MISCHHFVRRAAAAMLAAVLLPAASHAQEAVGTVSTAQVDVMNARLIILEGKRELVENGPQRWFLDSPSKSFTEVKRTDTELFLMPTGGGAGAMPLVIDFAAKRTYLEFAKINTWAAPVAMYPSSGYSMSRVEMIWGSTRVALDLNGTDNEGWTLTTYNTDGITPKSKGQLPAKGVSRRAREIAVRTASHTLVIDLVANTCTVTANTCTIARTLAISGLEVGHIKYGQVAFDRVTGASQWFGLSTLTQVSAKRWVEETSKGSVDWTEVSRDAAAVQLMRPDRTVLTFQMQAPSVVLGPNYDPTSFHVAQVQRQWPGQLGTVFQPVTPGVAPGFQIQNKTDYPVLVTLEQIGCLYYGIVKPGEIFQRNTGAVWFTIKASMAPDLTEPSVESCIRKPAMYAATIVVAGLTAAGTGGTATALVVPAMLATAAGQGAAIATQQYVMSTTGSASTALGARVGVTSLASGATVVGLAIISSGGSPMVASTKVVGEMLRSAGQTAVAGLPNLYTRWAEQSDIDSITGQLTQEASVFGAYAGYPWPWKMSDRVMPRYDITGGPRIRTMADGSTLVLKQDKPLTITKVN